MTSLAERQVVIADEWQRLLPRGPLWRWRDGAIARRLLEGLALPVAVLEQYFDRVALEADPRTTVDWLPDFERVYGLPDCTSVATSLVARRAAVVRKLNSPVGQTEAAIASVVEYYGLECVVETLRAAWIDETSIDDYLEDDDSAGTLLVHLPDPPVVFFEADWSGAGDPIAEHVGDVLECAVERVAPAHAALVFLYDLPGGTYQPWDPWEPTFVPAEVEVSVPPVTIEES